MDFSQVLPFSVVFMTLLTGSICLEIKIQETFGTKDDGMVNIGSTFSVYCAVPELKAGKLVVWYKKQAEKLPIVLGFNDFLLDPTAKTKFEGGSLNTGEEEDVIAYILNLKEDLGAEFVDSGEYGCAISSTIPDDTSDHSEQDIEYTSLIVIDPVDELHLYSVRKEEINDPLKYYKELVNGQEVIVDAGQEFYFRCMAIASNPPAEIKIFFNDKDITNQYKKEITENYVETDDIPGSAVSHHIAYDVSMTSKYPVQVNRDDNKRPFTCNASVPHTTTMELAIYPTMLYFPEVKCKDTMARYQQKLVQLKCGVRSDPPLKHARFIYNETTTIGEYRNKSINVGEKVGSMTMKTEPGEFGDELIYILEFTYAPEQSFRSYIFQAGNAIGTVTDMATLQLENPGAVQEADANVHQAMSFLTLLSIAVVCLRL